MVNNKTKQKRNNHTPTSEALIDCAMLPRSFTTLCSALDDKKRAKQKKKTPHPNERSNVAKKAERSGLTFLP
jgi:hypothetical protein